MRFLRVLLTDTQYQLKYGFYFLYLILSALYVGILLLLPAEIRREGAALMIWSDPAALGFFFIGGIVLLEKGEGLHNYLSVLPVTAGEYILAKVLSLSLVSTLAGMAIAVLGLGGQVQYLLLLPGLFLGSAVFTLFGLMVGVRAQSVNHYLVMGIPVGMALMSPSFVIFAGLTHPLVEVLPSTMLLRILFVTVGLPGQYPPPAALAGLVVWLAVLYRLTAIQFSLYLQRAEGITK